MNTLSIIQMDLLRNGNVPKIEAVQNENARCVEFILHQSGAAWEIPQGSAFLIRYRKPDGTKGVYDTMPDGSLAWDADGNRVLIRLAPQMLTVPGSVLIQISILNDDDVISTFAVTMDVSEDVADGAVGSEDYTNIGEWILPAATLAANEAKASAAEAKIDAQNADEYLQQTIEAKGKVLEIRDNVIDQSIKAALNLSNQLVVKFERGWLNGDTGENGGDESAKFVRTSFFPLLSGGVTVFAPYPTRWSLFYYDELLRYLGSYYTNEIGGGHKSVQNPYGAYFARLDACNEDSSDIADFEGFVSAIAISSDSEVPESFYTLEINVTEGESGYTANKNLNDIQIARESGQEVFCTIFGLRIPLISVRDGVAYFTGAFNGTIYQVELSDNGPNGNVVIEAHSFVDKAELQEALTPIDNRLTALEQNGGTSDVMAIIGDLDTLETREKGNLVGAINELYSRDLITLVTNENGLAESAPPLRELASGQYVLFGKFLPYAGAEDTITFSPKQLASVAVKADTTYVQAFNPADNTVRYFCVTDDSCQETVVRLSDLGSGGIVGPVTTEQLADGAVTYEKMNLIEHSESIVLFDPSQHTQSGIYYDIGSGSGLLKEMITNGFIAIVPNGNAIYNKTIKISAGGSRTRNIDTELDGYTVTKEALRQPDGTAFYLNGEKLGVARFTYTPTDELTEEWTAEAVDLSHNLLATSGAYILKNCELTQEMLDNGMATPQRIDGDFAELVKTIMGTPTPTPDFSDLAGKYALHIGDSYTKAMCLSGSAFVQLASQMGMAGVLNHGIASSTIRDGSNSDGYAYMPMVSRVCQRDTGLNADTERVPLDRDDIGYITFMGGTNDSAGIESSVGADVYDGASYHIYGAMNQILETLVNAYPDVPIIVILQPPCANNTATENPEGVDISGLGQSLKSVLVSQRKQKAVKEVAEVFARAYPNVYLVDCCFNWFSPLTAADLEQYWDSDLLHLTGRGYWEIANGTKFDSVYKALAKHFNKEEA